MNNLFYLDTFCTDCKREITVVLNRHDRNTDVNKCQCKSCLEKEHNKTIMCDICLKEFNLNDIGMRFNNKYPYNICDTCYDYLYKIMNPTIHNLMDIPDEIYFSIKSLLG